MAGGPLPPQNIEAEQSVLGSLLLDTDAILKVSPFLQPQDFYQESHRQIFQAILDLHEKRQPSDLVTLTDELERRDQLDAVGGAAYLASLANAVPSPVHVEHYGHIVERIAVLRRLIAASGEIAGMAYEESEDVDQIIDRAEEIIFGVAQRRLDRDLTPLAKHLEEYYDYIEQVSGQKGEIMGLPTGFDDLDKLLAGLQKADLIIVAGRPGMGKTSLALSIAYSVAEERNARIALFSLEMPAQQLAARLICAATDRNSRVDSLKLRSGKLTEHQLSEVMRAMGDLSQYEIYIDDSATLTPMELRAKARRLHAEKPLDLVIVDYLQLMRAGIRAENRVREVSYISQQLKALARELKVPVLACSQLSRAVELRHDKRPVLSDLRESGCLAGETLITRADTGERVPIRDLAEREEQAPILVFALDERYRLVVRPMTKVFPSGRKRVYELRTRSGRTIRASGNHPFRTIDGWQALEELSPGSRIAARPPSGEGPEEGQGWASIPEKAGSGLIEAEKERIGMTWREVQRGIDTSYCGSTLFKSGLSRERMTRVANALGSQPLRDLAESDVFWDEVTSIEPQGVEKVYDATVPRFHNFVANDLFVHNSIEQDADVVIFIYREVVGEEEADLANVADVIVAKHRNGPTGQLQLVFLKDRAQFVSAELRRVAA